MAWVCDSPYIYIGTQHIHNYEAYIEIDGEMKETETGFENDGTRIYFYEKNSKGYEEDLVWLAECKIKKDKLYLTIITDNYFECDGETFVLEQQPYEPRKTMEE